MAFYLENSKKDINLTGKDEEDFKIITIVDFAKKNNYLTKFVIIVT